MRFDLRLLDRKKLRARLERYTQRQGECLMWMGRRSPKGYGRLATGDGREVRVTHVVWFLAKRPPLRPREMICHTCDVPACVEIDHLWVGTCQQNIDDMIAKGRAWWMRRAAA
jgi:hypothetical protein